MVAPTLKPLLLGCIQAENDLRLLDVADLDTPEFDADAGHPFIHPPQSLAHWSRP